MAERKDGEEGAVKLGGLGKAARPGHRARASASKPDGPRRRGRELSCEVVTADSASRPGKAWSAPGGAGRTTGFCANSPMETVTYLLHACQGWTWAGGPSAAAAGAGSPSIVLVLDLPDDLFEDVLEGHDPQEPAGGIPHHRHRALLAPEGHEQARQRLIGIHE